VVGRPTDDYWTAHDSAIARAVDEVAERLVALGVRVVDVSTPRVGELPLLYRRIVGAEAFATLVGSLDSQPELFQRTTYERLEAGRATTAPEYIGALRSREVIAAHLADHLRGIDALLVPTAPIRATPIGDETVDGIEVRAALLSLCQPVSMMRWPALSIPGAVAVGERPAGVQLVGTGLDEWQLLGLAARIEGAARPGIASN
jgi:Asp-tRNA(Asn)/Glu-tRNA(Gln) amidotransferase A subunit family amidase